jgi:hypothetical protein
MDNQERDELLYAIVKALAERDGVTVEQLCRRLFFRAHLREPGLSIVPGFGCVDRNGMRGLDGPPADPSWF